MKWNEIWDDIVNFFESNIWNIVKFFAALFIGIVAIKLIINVINKVLCKTKMERIAEQFIVGSIKVFLYLILVLALLSIIGVQITGILTALSAAILAVGVALQNNIANLANGVIIVATKMFKKGDFITVNDHSGSIVDINFFFTTLMTSDNKKVTVPNSAIINSEVTNAGANKTRRIDFTFSVAYESDVEQVKKIVIDVMKSNGKIIDNEKHTPFCRLKTLGASSIDFFANCWCDNEDYWDVYYYVVENVYNEFKRNDISIPYAQLEVRNRTDKVVMPYNKAALQERVEKTRVQEEKFDLETADFTKLFKGKKKKASKKPAKSEANEIKTEEKKG